MNLPKRPVSDELLHLTVETKIDAGISVLKIRELIEAFASYEQEPRQAAGIVGFLDVEDIPYDRRGTFLKALLTLGEEPEARSRNLRQKTASIRR